MKKWMVITTALLIPVALNAMSKITSTGRQTARQIKAIAPLVRNATTQSSNTLERASDRLLKIYQTNYSKVFQNLRDAENKLRNRDRRLYDEYIKLFRGNNRLKQLDKLDKPLTHSQKEVLFGLDTQMLQSLNKYLKMRTSIKELEQLKNRFIPRQNNFYPKNSVHEQQVKDVLKKAKEIKHGSDFFNTPQKERNQIAYYTLQDQLQTALLEQYKPELINDLINAGANINTQFTLNPFIITDKNNPKIEATPYNNLIFMTPFDIALSQNNLDLLTLLLKNGFNPNLDIDGKKPLDKALAKGASEEFIIMLSEGILPKNKTERTEPITSDKSYFQSAKEWVKSWIW